MRQLVGCATCAKVSWIDSCFPCYLFQDCPEALRPREENDGDDTETEAPAEGSSDEEAPATEQRRGRLLKDENGYYVIDAREINELLDVNKYIEAWPRIPTEELHASSVQHPSHPGYRWLLNTRRVPVQASSSVSAATEHELPKCAGVGIKDRPLWLCKSCTTARHAIFYFSQLELGRPIAPSVLQPQHRHKSPARIGNHDLQTGSAAT